MADDDVDSYFLPGGILDSPSKDDLDHPMAGVDEFFPPFSLGGLSKATTSRVLGAHVRRGDPGLMPGAPRGPSLALGEEGRFRRLSMEGTNPMAKEFTPSTVGGDIGGPQPMPGQHFFPADAPGYVGLEAESPVLGHGKKGPSLSSPHLDGAEGVVGPYGAGAMLGPPPGVLPPPLLDVEPSSDGRGAAGGGMTASLLPSPSLVGGVSPGGPHHHHPLGPPGVSHPHANQTAGLPDALYTNEALHTPLLSVSLSPGPSPMLLPQQAPGPLPSPSPSTSTSTSSSPAPRLRVIAPVSAGPSPGATMSASKSSLFSSSPQQLVAPEPPPSAQPAPPPAPGPPKAWSTPGKSPSVLLAGAEAARRVAAGRSGPAQGDAGSAGSGTQEQSRVTAEASQAGAAGKKNAGGGSSGSSRGQAAPAQQQQPQQASYLATATASASGRAAGGKAAGSRGGDGQQGAGATAADSRQAPPASADRRQQPATSTGKAGRNSAKGAATSQQPQAQPPQQAAKGGAAGRRGSNQGKAATPAPKEERRWADVANAMAETSIKGTESQETSGSERAHQQGGAGKKGAAAASAAGSGSGGGRKGKGKGGGASEMAAAHEVKQQQQGKQAAAHERQQKQPAVTPQEVSGRAKDAFDFTQVYKHQRQNAEAAKPDRFSDLISDSDSSEDSTVSSLTDENSSHNSKDFKDNDQPADSSPAVKSIGKGSGDKAGAAAAATTGKRGASKQAQDGEGGAASAGPAVKPSGGKGGKKGSSPSSAGSSNSSVSAKADERSPAPVVTTPAEASSSPVEVPKETVPAEVVPSSPEAAAALATQPLAAPSSSATQLQANTTTPATPAAATVQRATTSSTTATTATTTSGTTHQRTNSKTSISSSASSSSVTPAPMPSKPPSASTPTTSLPSPAPTASAKDEAKPAVAQVPAAPAVSRGAAVRPATTTAGSAAASPSPVKALMSLLPRWVHAGANRISKAGLLSMLAVLLSWVLDLVVAGVGFSVAVLLAALLVVLQLHRYAIIELGSNTSVALCFAVPYTFKAMAGLVMDWAPHWGPVCLWYLFLVHMFWSGPTDVPGPSSAGEPASSPSCSPSSSASPLSISRPSRVVLPLLFLAEGISRQSFLLDLNGPELLLLSFFLAALKLRRITSPLFLLSWSFQVLAVNYLNSTHSLWQYAQLIIALTSLRAMSVVDAMTGGSCGKEGGAADLMMLGGTHKPQGDATGRKDDGLLARVSAAADHWAER